MTRQSWINTSDNAVPLSQQCELIDVTRSTVYNQRKPKVCAGADDEPLSLLIDQEYTRHPYYGSRKMVVYLGCDSN